jgi:serine phosphatase RsbU (regulator of sigma subunit)
MIDPVKFRRILIFLIKALIVLEIIGAINDGMSTGQWGRLGFDLVIAGILYLLWDRIQLIIREKRTEYHEKMEHSSESIRLWDALIFSLLWTDEIYAGIPRDRQRLVIISYTLIVAGLVVAFLEFGPGLMPLVVSGALVLAAVNLMMWVVARERTEKESLQTEIKLAHDVQMALMPKEQAKVAGFDIAGISIPAEVVGGDLYDYAYLGGSRTKLGISVFDVSGKGMQAAMSAVYTSGAFAGESAHTESPAAALTRLNKAIYPRVKRGQFVAYLLAALDPETKDMVFANAGQTKPLLKSNGTIRWLDHTGVNFPLGMTEDAVYCDTVHRLQRGDVLILMSDGFTEAMNTQREMFGTERLAEFIRDLDSRQVSAQGLIDTVTEEVRLHMSGSSQHDDMTMVVVKAV